jgi:hypothetical protein
MLKRYLADLTRRRFVEGRAARALHEKPQPGGRSRIDGKQGAFLVALACSGAPPCCMDERFGNRNRMT